MTANVPFLLFGDPIGVHILSFVPIGQLQIYIFTPDKVLGNQDSQLETSNYPTHVENIVQPLLNELVICPPEFKIFISHKIVYLYGS